MIYVFPAVTALIGLALGLVLLRYGFTTAAWVVTGLLTVLMVWGFYKSQTAQGWDALGYVVLWLLGAAPALVGMAAGATFGRRMRIKAEMGKPSD